MAKLYFYYSTMNAGKTTVLLQSAYNYTERGMRALLLSPAIDDRAGQGMIRSRVGIESPALAVGPKDDLFELVESELDRGQIHCVLTDESQFFTRQQIFDLTEVVDRLRIPVLAFGLRTDFQGELFEGSRYLLAWADELKELKTICHTGSKATMVVRVDEQGYAVTDGAQVEIGGNDRYVPVSRAEFKLVFYGGKRVRLFEVDQSASQGELPDL
ncbi:thymidine kinase [Wenzhouxiangella marina]|uniref:Thymidine kinase n=1 Tax=Wenzhouxiangella marina TaxID=1579979 RepID=A0A0K0Y0E7_9GAMM|nr:thymidine kinase [Wenzhouxiangella marina]AKS43409.1 Thymidine kinase [Wenzhouxiangella marina]MBB6088297.1 thymidine kinase [Wenzhouxiangella marina]